MAVNGSLLQGEVVEDVDRNEKDVERLLMGFLEALLKEQKGGQSEEAPDEPA